MKHYQVVAGIIKHDQQILCVQRGKGKYDYISYKYEFPGGKIENGETKEDALVREIKEELELDIYGLEELIEINHTYPDFSLTMYCFMAQTHSQMPVLKEHLAFKWLPIDDLQQLDWAAADIPAVKKLTGS
ncbi:(deoxy)nucleoside triphosphate pyrophosphohydrolase [Flaviaesturariibacter aridisoli]|uniref:8-oxo-dGTP diphosphatase n=1 Tax=Flaviaesturariibacter aridisoli TaxID=2545761 RepID=A0A4R4E191_9BACT|nr:(deoxy)nucleoside triphosphate pyrophosphohydrolase [Flaviaesturariibacter aridisoli]TCZ71818.1 (deoxy)nucleoside triphosphate pyrophosphohydrolase [Flaviaesturariibacter aridisoli]